LSLGLAYAHNKNIIHSDFKPGNAFLTGNRQVRILDFGIARAAPVERFEASEQTRFDAGEIGALTPSYAACEMFEGKEPHPADDVYALAIVAYQLLSGRHPFDNVPAPQARQQGLEPKPIKGLKRREWRALRRGLAFGREARSKHAAEFLADLEGPSRVKVLAVGAGLLGALFVAYVGYVQFQERARALPDIPFEQLSTTDQARISGALAEGAMFMEFGDEGSALMLYREAYALHPRNPDVVAALESLFTRLGARALERADRAELGRLQENLQQVMAIDDFLGNRPALVSVRAELEAALR
jgi:serine/threonine protein kinase